ncbi:MAG: phosphoglycerate kinase [Christensenellaceae bacterium]|jgi:phosphoglycerate kinase|nr:phosphoglycerate kinase [Christensenellaceae bacterium]
MEKVINSVLDINVEDKTVLFRPDINSPIDSNKKISNLNRLEKSLPTLNYLLNNGARVAIIAHQGDTLDYHNLIPLKEHASILSKLSNKKVDYIDDVCGGAAIKKIKTLKKGEAVILGNLRYLTEEVSTFERDVKLNSQQMKSTYLIRSLTPHFDMYVNDAFSAAHRNSPSMTGFQSLLPSYAGALFYNEINALTKVMRSSTSSTFILGGAKISDAFGMMDKVLNDGIANKILACGVTGIIMIMATGVKVGKKYYEWLNARDLLSFIDLAKRLLNDYHDKFILPMDVAFDNNGERFEISIKDLDTVNELWLDIGDTTIEVFKQNIMSASTIFMNGPPGVYENKLFDVGTREIFKAVTASSGYSVIGGGDTVSSASRFIDLNAIDYVSTAGGAMIQFISGKMLPLIEAFNNINAES